MPPVLAKLRKDFSADALFRLTRSYFGRMDDSRQGKIRILLGDALMSAFAMFSLKDPSYWRLMNDVATRMIIFARFMALNRFLQTRRCVPSWTRSIQTI